jgi:DNA-binding response OmpR family regulator
MLDLALRNHGYRVVSIGDRREGWTERPDAVLLDLRLRGETARDFLAAAGLDPAIPVILVTAEQQSSAAGRAILPVAATIRKPFDLDQLYATLDAVLAEAR